MHKQIMWVFILISSMNGSINALDRNDLRTYKDTVVTTWNSTARTIKRAALKVWYWNNIIDEQDYLEHKREVEAMSAYEQELEQALTTLRASIKDVPDSVYTFIKASLDLIKTKKRNAWNKQRVLAYEKIKQFDEQV